ncbi:unnamed protein product [Menidia menidia]|uniref:(Atlantic silverside) hypothetical protein n=1 Tax=Menidia menidia TaxID=238744 RepID=A0A8S4ADC0_9TELE|nr:unnamed protein product [Menidia menidia]
MFSDGGATAPGEPKGFKPHTPHFIPWLRNSLKAQHSAGDLGLNGAYKAPPEPRSGLAPPERARGMGLFSIPGRDRAKKGELRYNGLGMLPVVLRGHHLLPGGLGKQREDAPPRWNQTKEPDSNSSRSQDHHTGGRKPGQQPQDDGTGPSGRKYGPLVGPLVGPPPTPVCPPPTEGPEQGPVVLLMEGQKRRGGDYSSRTTLRHRDRHASSWLGPDSQGPPGGPQGLSHIHTHLWSAQSQRDLRAVGDTPVERCNGLLFSTPAPHTGLGFTTTVRGPRRARPTSDRISLPGQDQTWVQDRPSGRRQSQEAEAGGSRKLVRNQIQRVVDNLEQVLKALRDVQQEMKEVVQQIDYLTSSIDLDEEEPPPPGDTRHSWGFISGEGRVVSSPQRPTEGHGQPPPRSRPPQSAPLCLLPSGLLSDTNPALRLTCDPSSSPREAGLLPPATNELVSSDPPQNRTSNHPILCPPPDSDTQPAPTTDAERRASSAGPESAAPGGPPKSQGRRGRKPPPYPHNPPQLPKEPRKAPPYPDKRRLLSTTV